MFESIGTIIYIKGKHIKEIRTVNNVIRGYIFKKTI